MNCTAARYHRNGSLDTTFAGTGMLRTDFRSGTDDTAYAVKLQQHAGVTKILAAGHSRGPSTTETRQDFALIRYNDNGTLDTTFGTGGKVWSDFGGADSEDVVRALEIDSTGRIIAAGYAGNTFAVARYLPGNTVFVEVPPAPHAPTNVLADPASATQINVEWSDNIETSITYNVYRDTAPDFLPAASNRRDSGLTSSAYIDSGVTAGSYYYAVTAVRGGVESDPTWTGWAADSTLPPSLPEEPLLFLEPLTGRIDVTWSDAAINELGFEVERSDDNGTTWPHVFQVGTNINRYSDTAIQDGVLYHYRVRAYNASGGSTYSEVETAKLPESWGISAYLPYAQSTPDASLPDGHEETLGVSMRANTDNLETDLVKAVLVPKMGDYNYFLNRPTSNINVWADPNRTTAILGPNGNLEESISLAAGSTTVWVEYTMSGVDPAATFLELRAVPPAGPDEKDRVALKPAEVLVILISGHTQNGANDNDQPNGGNTEPKQPSVGASIRFIAESLGKPEVGFSNRVEFSEDPGNKKGDHQWNASDQQHCGATWPDIMSEINRQLKPENQNRPTTLALIGYSHGGGLAFLVAQNVVEDNLPIDVRFSAYIDGVKNPIEPYQGFPKPVGEERVPPSTAYHVNWYQSKENVPNLGLWPNGVKSVHEYQGQIKHNEDLDQAVNLVSHRDVGADPAKNHHSNTIRLGIVQHMQTAIQGVR